MTDPCEDALAKAREAIVYADECFEAALAEGLRDALADNDGERVHDLWSRRLSFARDKFPDALAALSTPPSQSESDDEKLVEAFIAAAGWKLREGSADALRGDVRKGLLAVAHKALTPSPTPYVRPAESAVVLTLIDALTGLESSYEEGEGVSYARLEARSAIKTAQDFLSAPTPYVRPAAEIRAKATDVLWWSGEDYRAGWHEALIWTLTPPTQEPR